MASNFTAGHFHCCCTGHGPSVAKMKRFFTSAGVLYVVFAILCAYSYRSESASTVAGNQDSRSDVAANTGSSLAGAQLVRGTYSTTARVTVWSTPGCYGCEQFKRDAVPTLIAEGIVVEIVDATVVPPQDKTITSYPTIIVYDGDTEVKRFVGNTAVSVVLEAVPQTIEPPDYRIWFWPWR